MWEGLWVGGKDSVTSWLRVGGGTKKPRRAQHGVDDKEQHTTTVVRGGVRGAGWAWAHKRRNADMIFTFHAEKNAPPSNTSCDGGKVSSKCGRDRGVARVRCRGGSGLVEAGGAGRGGRINHATSMDSTYSNHSTQSFQSFQSFQSNDSSGGGGGAPTSQYEPSHLGHEQDIGALECTPMGTFSEFKNFCNSPSSRGGGGGGGQASSRERDKPGKLLENPDAFAPDDLWCLETTFGVFAWKRLSVVGRGPGKCHGHTASTVPDVPKRVFFFGGRTAQTEPSSDVFVLNTVQVRLCDVSPLNGPLVYSTKL